MKLKELSWEDYLVVAQRLLQEMIENDDRKTTPEEFLEMDLSDDDIKRFNLKEDVNE